MKMKILFFARAAVFLLFPLSANARELSSLPEFTKDDRVLVLAPHPDDETLGAGGAIQRAIAAGARVQVACYTNGDHNQLAFIVYEKRLTFRTGEFLYMGELRRSETVKAMTSLGLDRQDLIFLGYPDFGTMAILTQFWQTQRSYRSLMTRISKVAYPQALSPGSPYVGESILKDLKTVIADFQPTKIFVSHPADTNRDHQSLYLFTWISLWDLEDKIAKPAVYPYLIHVVGWPKPRGHHLDLALKPPERLGEISWMTLALSREEVKTKQKLVDFYQTEIAYNPPYLYSYVRKNELFGDFPAIPLKDDRSGKIAWHNVGLFLDLPVENNTEGSEKQQGALSGLAYALQGNDLLIRLDLRRKLDKNLGSSIYLLGYKKNVSFAAMPKIKVEIGILGMRIRKNGRLISASGAKLGFVGRSLIVKLPLSALGKPDRILSRVRTRAAKFPLNASAWRILIINDGRDQHP